MVAWIVLGSAAWGASPVDRYAVVIGSNDGHPDEAPLAYAEQDAERMADLLTTLGGFRSENLVSLRGQRVEEVRAAFASVARRVATDRADGDEVMLFVYYSGHADNTALHLGRTDLSFTELKRLAESVASDVRVLVVDACRSGELTRLKGATLAQPFTIRAEDRLDSQGLVIITSSSAVEDSQESNRLQGGVFTHHFVAGLLGAADTSGDARITLNEAYRYGYARTLEATSQAPVVQHPTYAIDLRGSDDLVLTRLDVNEHGGRLVLRDAGTWLVFVDPTAALHTEATVAAGGSLTLPPGRYLVRLRDPDGIWESAIELARTEQIELGRDDMTAVPYGAVVRRGLSEHRSSAAAATLGGGVSGPWVPDTPAAAVMSMGGRLEFASLSLGLRGHVARNQLDGSGGSLLQRRFGLDLEAVHRLDVGWFAPGVGARIGADLISQAFETERDLDPHLGVVGRIGPWLGADLALGSRISLGFSAGLDMALYRGLGDLQITTQPVPYALAEVVTYVR